MTNNDAQEYNIAAIRQLLLAAFTPEELRRYYHPTGHSTQPARLASDIGGERARENRNPDDRVGCRSATVDAAGGVGRDLSG